eukprot:2430741-Amphidinium_carterae.1
MPEEVTPKLTMRLDTFLVILREKLSLAWGRQRLCCQRESMDLTKGRHKQGHSEGGFSPDHDTHTLDILSQPSAHLPI